MQIELNLATRPYLNRRAVTLWILLVGGFMVLLLAINLGYVWQSYRQVKQIDQNLAELNRQLAEAPGLPMAEFNPKAYAEALKQVEADNQIIIADQFRWTKLLDRLEELLPDGVRIQTIQPDFKKKSVRLVAVARDVSGLTEFMDNLLGSTDFNQAFLSNQAETEVKLPGGASGGSVVSFSLEIREAF